jgi:hypothetical protein
MNLRSILTTNIQMKLLSLLLAAMLWLFIALEEVGELEIPLSISYVNRPAGLVIKTSQDLDRQMIRIEGPKILLLRQKWKGAAIFFDLSGAKEGKMLLPGMESQVKLVQGVKLVLLPPLKVELHR